MLRRAAFSPNIKERADCSAALFTADGRAARAGRAHPGAPRLDAGVGARRDRALRCGRRRRPGRPVILNDPFAGGTHLNDITLVAPCFARRRRALVGWVGQPRPPRRRRRRGARARCPPTRPRSSRRGCASRPCASPPRCGRCCWPTPARPTSGPATSTRRSGANVVGVERLADFAPASRSTRCSPTASGACGPRCADLPDGAWTLRGRARLLRARPPTSRSPTRIVVTVTIAGDEHHVRLHRHRPATAGQRERGRGGDGQRRSLRAAGRRSIPTIPANGGALRPVTRGRRRRARSSTRRPPAAVGAGNVEVSQRVADVCLGALAQALPDRSAPRRRGR